MEDFNLIYYHKETGKKYLVKRVTPHDFVIMDPEYPDARLRLSDWALKKAYRPDKANNKAQAKNRLNFRNRKVS